jgi:hypothetical protein
MENAWIGVNLESYSDHPLNRGWMNVFRRWTSSRTLQRHWPAIRGEFSEGFVRFCESELNLTVATPTVVWLDCSTGSDLRLMSWGAGSGVPTSGNEVVIVGIDNNGLLHIRIFDAGGNRITDTDETKLPGTQAGAISTLKQLLAGLLPPHVLTSAEKAQVLSEVTSITGQTRSTKPATGCGIEHFRSAIEHLDKEFRLEWPHVVLREIRDGYCTLSDIFDYACRYPPSPTGGPRVGLVVPGVGHRHSGPSAEPAYYGVILAWEAPDDVIDLVVWLRGAYRTLGLGRAIAEAIERLKEDLRSSHGGGYTLRTRYPGDDRNKGKQRWQSNLWSEFFRGRGFHSRDDERAGDDMATLYYKYEPL